MSDYDEGYRAGMQKMRDLAYERIEDLEAKLAKVVSAGVRVRDYYGRYTNIDVYAVSDFNAVVEEVKGQKDE